MVIRNRVPVRFDVRLCARNEAVMLKNNKRVIITFLGPALLCYALVFLYPVFRTLVMSFQGRKRIGPGSEMGLRGLRQLQETLYHAYLSPVP